MKQFNMTVAGVCAGLTLLGGTGWAQPGRVDFGHREFVASCARCTARRWRVPPCALAPSGHQVLCEPGAGLV
jgi:hypothetical protein